MQDYIQFNRKDIELKMIYKNMQGHLKLESCKLENGITLYTHNNNDNDLNIFLIIKVGSLNETKKEKGIAHFLEHVNMSYDKKYKYKKSYNKTTAITDFYFTKYNINVANKESNIQEVINIIQSIILGTNINIQSVSEAREDIINEYFAKVKSIKYRESQVILSNSMYKNRMPIGTLKNIQMFDYNQLLRFHQKWYIPNNIAIGVIGKINIYEFKKRLDILSSLNIQKPNTKIDIDNSIKYYPINWNKSKVRYLKNPFNNKKVYCIEYIIKNKLYNVSNESFYKDEVLDLIIDKLIELKIYNCLTNKNLNDSLMFISNTPFFDYNFYRIRVTYKKREDLTKILKIINLFLKDPYTDENDLLSIINNLRNSFQNEPDGVHEISIDCNHLEGYIENYFVNREYFYQNIIYKKDEIEEILSIISVKDVNDRIYHRLSNSEKMILIKE